MVRSTDTMYGILLTILISVPAYFMYNVTYYSMFPDIGYLVLGLTLHVETVLSTKHLNVWYSLVCIDRIGCMYMNTLLCIRYIHPYNPIVTYLVLHVLTQHMSN